VLRRHNHLLLPVRWCRRHPTRGRSGLDWMRGGGRWICGKRERKKGE
jgi:hypothetical protein